MEDEKRFNERYQTGFKLVQLQDIDSKKLSYGCIKNLSSNGASLLKRDDTFDSSHFMIFIPLPDTIEDEQLVIEAQKIWENDILDAKFNEIGCTFINVSSEQKEKLDQFIDFLGLITQGIKDYLQTN